MGRSARVALSLAATDGSKLHRIKSRSCQSRDGPDGIAGREFSFATRADPGKEPHADTRSTSRARRVGECTGRCVEVRTACGSGRDLSMWNDTDTPLAHMITFRCYGTWLHGDVRGDIV